MPAQAGIQWRRNPLTNQRIPAFAEMTTTTARQMDHHSGAGRNPQAHGSAFALGPWTPTFVGVTRKEYDG
jgi:hypothetical protein